MARTVKIQLYPDENGGVHKKSLSPSGIRVYEHAGNTFSFHGSLADIRAFFQAGLDILPPEQPERGLLSSLPEAPGESLLHG